MAQIRYTDIALCNIDTGRFVACKDGIISRKEGQMAEMTDRLMRIQHIIASQLARYSR